MYEELLIKLAKKAEKNGDFPVAAIIVKNNKIIAQAYNKKERDNNAIQHAEIIAISKACKKLKTWRLEGCEMYITIEPCLMCFGAITQARIKTVNYFYKNDKFGYESNQINNNGYKNTKFNQIEIKNSDYQSMIKTFFKYKRNREKQ